MLVNLNLAQPQKSQTAFGNRVSGVENFIDFLRTSDILSQQELSILAEELQVKLPQIISAKRNNLDRIIDPKELAELAEKLNVKIPQIRSVKNPNIDTFIGYPEVRKIEIFGHPIVKFIRCPITSSLVNNSTVSKSKTVHLTTKKGQTIAEKLLKAIQTNIKGLKRCPNTQPAYINQII